MNFLKSLGLFWALLVLAAGCGDEDSSSTDSRSEGFAPVAEADLTDLNNVYNVTLPGQGTVTLRFPTAGRYQFVSSGQTISGTVSNWQRHGDGWNANLSPDVNTQPATAGALTLTWTRQNSGTFTLQPQSGPAQSGTFTVTRLNPGSETGGSTSGSGNTSGGSGSSPGLVGKTLQLTYTSSGATPDGEKFFFASLDGASFGNGTDTASYSYDSSTGQLTIRRSGGQTYRLILVPGSSAGTTSVLFQQPGGVPSNTSASYTLR